MTLMSSSYEVILLFLFLAGEDKSPNILFVMRYNEDRKLDDEGSIYNG